MYPTEVDVNEKAVAKLTSLYKEAYKNIVEEINSATEWGTANRRMLLAQIKQELTNLGVDVQEILESELTKQYTVGAKEAVMQLGNVGADIAVESGFNLIHKDAIAALVDDSARAFGETLTGVQRSANLLINKASRDMITQKLAQGIIGGKALREVRQSIKGILAEQGLDALVDKAGHKWTLDRYAEMLLRTKSVEARNRGLVNRMAENGYDLVQVSNHNSQHEECRVWEGKVLSVTGSTPGYPTVADAEIAGLFHPNCKHAINVLIPSLANKTRAYANPSI